MLMITPFVPISHCINYLVQNKRPSNWDSTGGINLPQDEAPVAPNVVNPVTQLVHVFCPTVLKVFSAQLRHVWPSVSRYSPAALSFELKSK